jgi:Integrase core domain
MAAEGIVEAVDGTADCDRGFDPALEDAAPPDEFGLEGLEERLDHGVVEAVSLARHRDRDAVLSQLSLGLDGAVLATTVRVVNEPGGWAPHGECVFLNAFETGGAARDGIGRWLDYYNRRRPHSALGDRTPDEAYGIEIDLENLAA